MRIRTGAAAVILACIVAAAGAQEFTNLGIGGGGGLYTPSVSPHDAQLMMASCDMGGVYISRDGAQSWKMLHYKDLSSIIQCKPLFHPYDRRVIFAGTGSTLKRSGDAGETWETLAGPGAVWGSERITMISMPSAGRKVIYLGTTGGIYYSQDDGATWSKGNGVSGECTGLLAIATHAYAAVGTGVYHSGDGGKTWEAYATGHEAKQLAAFAGGMTRTGSLVLFAAVEGVGLIGSDNHGRTWRTLVEAGDIHEIVMAPNQTANAYAANRSTIWRTTNSGRTWESCFRMKAEGEVARNVTPSWVQTELSWGYAISPNGLGVSATNANLVMVATQGDLYISRNAGVSWTPAINRLAGRLQGESGATYESIGLEVTSAWEYLFNPWRPRINYIAYTDIGFVKGLERWRSWIPSSKGSPWYNTFYQVVFDPFVVGRMYAATSNQHDIPHWTQLEQAKDTGGVVVSVDHGTTWKVAGTGLPQKPATSIAIDPASTQDALTMYAALYGDGVYKTTDAGATWARKSDGLGREGNNHAFMVKVQAGTGRVYCSVTARREGLKFAVPGGLWVSENGGESWRDLTAELNLGWAGGFDFDPADSDVIYLTASTIPGSNEGGLYRTTDGGASWTRLLKDEDFASGGGPGYVQSMFVSVSPHHAGHVYLSTVGQGLWLSRDSGATWAQVEGIPFASISRVCFAPIDKETIYVTTFGGGVWRGPARPGAAAPSAEEAREGNEEE